MSTKFSVLVFFATILLTGCGPDDDNFSIGCLPANLQNGIIAFYPFENGDLSDASANNNDLTNTTTAIPASDRNGNPMCAYQFSNFQGQDEFLTTTDSDFLNDLSSFSVSLWFQGVDSTRDGSLYEVLLSRGTQGRCPDRRGEWSVGLYDCRRPVFGHDNSVWAFFQTNPVDCQGEINPFTGTWYHVAAVKSNDNYKIYLDGVLQEEEDGPAGCTDGYLAQNIGDLFLGKFYHGKLDDVIIFNRAISAQEVGQLYSNEACCE